MSGINRFLSRREKAKSVGETALFLHELFSDDDHLTRKTAPEKKIEVVRNRLGEAKRTTYSDSDITYALFTTYACGDPERAFELINLTEESQLDPLPSFDPQVKLLGAVNRNSVSCYLDAILFAMFAHLDNFEAMFKNKFDTPQTSRLASFLRLWITLLRRGRLITVDITRQLLEAMAACGWKEVNTKQQQDASEAFGFLTETLRLPMLTLKMDIFHTGREDAKDDHKVIRERLLEVAIPEDAPSGGPVTLEHCLETYFNSRIEVKRYLERRATNASLRSRPLSSDSLAKNGDLHIESVEVAESEPSTPRTSTIPGSPPSYSASWRFSGRHRSTSIIQDKIISESEDKVLEAGFAVESNDSQVQHSTRVQSVRKEVLMPAWQFFSLIPWSTHATPSSDSQVAAHLSTERPVLGICLKRYFMNKAGKPERRDTYVDIPTEMALPHFIHEDSLEDDPAALGNFKLSLQSVVCHRGVSVDSGHYISLARGSHDGGADKWMLFDDLAKGDRVQTVDIDKALRDESPYLLFYQVLPVSETPKKHPPSHIDAGSADITAPPSINTPSSGRPGSFFGAERPSYESHNSSRGRSRGSPEGKPGTPTAQGFPPYSAKAGPPTQDSAIMDRRLSSGLTSPIKIDIEVPKRSSKVRSGSHEAEKRLSTSFTRLTGMLSSLNSKSNGLTVPASALSDAGTRDGVKESTKPSGTIAEEQAGLTADDSKAKKHRLGRSKDKSASRGKAPSSSSPRKGTAKQPDRECSMM